MIKSAYIQVTSIYMNPKIYNKSPAGEAKDFKYTFITPIKLRWNDSLVSTTFSHNCHNLRGWLAVNEVLIMVTWSFEQLNDMNVNRYFM